MTMPDDDPELSGLFAVRRRRDEGGAPPFERVLRRAKSPEASRKAHALLRPRLVAVAALCVLCGLAVWAGYRWRHPGSPLAAPPPSLTAWKAPTDFLLELPGGALLDSTPVLVDPRPPSAPLPDRPFGT